MGRMMCVSLILLGSLPSVAFAQRGKAKVAAELFKAGVRIVTGAAAAESMRRAGNSTADVSTTRKDAALAREEYERIRRQRIDAVLKQFQSAGLSDKSFTIYSIFLDINYNVPCVYWADTFSNPDVFFVVEVEGHGQFILPAIRYEYRGGPALDKIVLPTLQPGTRVVVRVLDDDTNGDAIWQSILSKKVDYRFNVDGITLVALGAVQCHANLEGGFQALDGDQRVTIDGPDQLATVTFRIPDTQDPTWVADGELRCDDRSAGRVQFSQIWNTQSELAALERELERRAVDAERKHASSIGWLLFWGVVGIVCLFWFFKSFSSKNSPSQSKSDLDL